MKVKFIQAHFPDSPQMRGAYRNYDCEKFINFILQNSRLNEVMYLNMAKDGRPI
jgi:hypothetical protein